MSEPLFSDNWTAEAVREKLRKRYPATQMMGTAKIPGPWVTVEEWKRIDLLAIGVTGSSGREWIAHEVKVSRSDFRAELKDPFKRDTYKTFSHRLYFVVPEGLLKPDEIAYVEPKWESERCPGHPEYGLCEQIYNYKTGARGKVYKTKIPRPTDDNRYAEEVVKCETCNGLGDVGLAKLIEDAPTLWIPADVGLITVNARGTKVVKEAPAHEFGGDGKTRDRWGVTGDLTMDEMADLARWISARPDPRHNGVVEEARETQKGWRDADREYRERQAA